MASHRTQPALLGGLFIGVLSSLPLVSALNGCCCLWVVTGGLLTTYLLQQQQQPQPVETADAVLTALIASVIGSVISIVVSAAVLQWTGPLWQDQLRNQIDANPDLPPQIRDLMLGVVTGRGLAFLQFAVTLPMYAIFSVLGALLGLAIFRKKTPPAPPPGPIVQT